MFDTIYYYGEDTENLILLTKDLSSWECTGYGDGGLHEELYNEGSGYGWGDGECRLGGNGDGSVRAAGEGITCPYAEFQCLSIGDGEWPFSRFHRFFSN